MPYVLRTYVRELTSEGAVAFVERLVSLGDQEIRRVLVGFLGFPPEPLKPEVFEVSGISPGRLGHHDREASGSSRRSSRRVCLRACRRTC